MSLRFSQIFLTDGLTFMLLLLVPVGDPAAIQVVRGELDDDAVAGEDADVVHAHLPGDVGQDLVPVCQLHPEHRVREGLDDGALDLDGPPLLWQAPPSRRTDPKPAGSDTDWDGAVRQRSASARAHSLKHNCRAQHAGPALEDSNEALSGGNRGRPRGGPSTPESPRPRPGPRAWG